MSPVSAVTSAFYCRLDCDSFLRKAARIHSQPQKRQSGIVDWNLTYIRYVFVVVSKWGFVLSDGRDCWGSPSSRSHFPFNRVCLLFFTLSQNTQHWIYNYRRCFLAKTNLRKSNSNPLPRSEDPVITRLDCWLKFCKFVRGLHYYIRNW